MNKPLMLLGAWLAPLLLSPQVLALQERHAFDVSVTIPEIEAYVLPSEPDWMGREQTLAWDLVKSRLSPLRKDFDVKNLNGGVAARLGDTPYLLSGTDRIDLQVLFNKVPLNLSSTEVINANEARIGRRAALDIAAIEPEGGYKAGDYYGTVHIVFDFLVP
ncbi:CS1 type fimbrial major subunit [Pseudomonas mucidolens]|uniref:CS1 type fimbrial major subunit n=1 Tax=Pseudomonas mucidolens TaxID=46679 RepID=UPI0030DB663B